MTTTVTLTSPQEAQKLDLASQYFHYSSRLLAIITWLSCGLFGLYILIFYAGGLVIGQASLWNNVLPNLYAKSQRLSTLGIAIHFAAGGIILAMGFIQLLSVVRIQVPRLHAWLGRIYVIAAVFAGIGGLTFIITTGTIGGLVMDLGFGLYGLLMILCAIQTYRFARSLQFHKHRAFAIRLFALAIGSWLYRMEYGFWFLITDELGHSRLFQGPFDYAMDFFFYLPNLLIAEAYLQASSVQANTITKLSAASLLGLTTGFLVLATYFFATQYWIPEIIGLVG